jgi:glycosyltransferase involved in cell wall biosynthesis
MRKLSIITVCWNNRDGLEETIHSIINQSFKDFEFLIVDGQSTDGTVDLIKQYDKNISWWVSEQDSGIYNAMNKGIQKAKGKYCLFLNSGDVLSSNGILQEVFDEDHDVDILYGNLIRKKGKKSYRISRYPDKLTLFNFYAPVPSIHHQASFIKRSLFDKLGFYREDFKIISDWEFFFRAIILNNCSIKHINKNISIFDSFGISSSGNNSEQELKTNTLLLYFPQRVLDDYESLMRSRSDWKTRIKNKVASNKAFFSIVRLFYLPVVKAKSYINYLKIKA